jgi:hypothetical protein
MTEHAMSDAAPNTADLLEIIRRERLVSHFQKTFRVKS